MLSSICCSNPLGKKVRTSRLISVSKQRSFELRTKLDEAKKKRSRLIELIHQLNSFRDYSKLQGVDADSLAGALALLEQKICTEVMEESKELADLCNELHLEVKDKRKDVMDLLAEVLIVKPQQNSVKEKQSTDPA